jgi:hypothetical protein
VLFSLLPVRPALATVKSLPWGIYCLPGRVSTSKRPQKPADWQAWENPHLLGVVARESWEQLEPSDGKFNFGAFLDQVATLAVNKKKFLQISVSSGADALNQFWPSWLRSAGVQFITFPSSGLTVPAPWDPIFQAKWRGLIDALGSRYDNKSYLHCVEMQGPGRAGELFFAEDQVDYDYMNANYPNWVSQWQVAAETIAGFYAAAFVHTPLMYANGRPLPLIIDPQNTTYGTVVSYLSQTYNNGAPPWCFGDRDSGYYYNADPIQWYSQYGLSFQGYQQNKPTGNGAAQEAIQLIGSPYYALWFEVYDGDCEDANNYSAFDAFNTATYNPNQNQ